MAIDELTRPRKFPDYEASLREVVAEHARIEDEPLLYAAYVELDRDREHVFLFEIAENFGRNEPDPHRELWEAGFQELGQVPLAGGQQVRMILTNPTEFRLALKEDWHGIRELRAALKAGKWIRLWGEGSWEEEL